MQISRIQFRTVSSLEDLLKKVGEITQVDEPQETYSHPNLTITTDTSQKVVSPCSLERKLYKNK